jgi:hypothetical protein
MINEIVVEFGAPDRQLALWAANGASSQQSHDGFSESSLPWSDSH